MSLFRRLQDHPDADPVEFTTAVTHALKSLDENPQLVQRWFWKGLLAFNLVLGSLVLWIAVLRSL